MHVMTPTLGRSQFGHCSDFARPARAQFEHGVVVVRLDGRHAQRDAEMVIEIAGAGRSPQLRAEYGVDHFPCSALAGAAGNADDRAGELSPPPAGPIVQRPMRIVDADDPGMVWHGPLSLWERVRVRAALIWRFGDLEIWSCGALFGPHPRPLSQRERGEETRPSRKGRREKSRATSLLTTAPAAPRENASPMKSSPRWFGPRSVQNTSPDLIVRLSLTIGPMGVFDGFASVAKPQAAWRPAIAAQRSASVAKPQAACSIM